MSLLNYLMSKDFFTKAMSSKPVSVIARDGFIVTIVTLLITLVYVWFYYTATGTFLKDRNYGSIIISTIVTTMLFQFIYEFVGINNILAESSIRYAKGSTLVNYTSRRDAMVHTCYYRLLIHNQKHNKYSPETLTRNFKLLRTVVTKPVMIGRLMLGDSIPRLLMLFSDDPDDLNTSTKINEATKLINDLMQISEKNKQAFELISEKFNENIAYDIIVNGFSNYTMTEGPVFSTIDNMEEREESGRKIMLSLETAD